ncbi:phage holin family protein [Kallotenue papyrolyticum]|uniref:phage holin family protein n=1 Tax=Kallotenue papyrolyticum TaxID=1325125 RepID=UPI0004B414E8|nr:phage holin family protein [Kallotenue papyrolyticum]
MIPLRFDIKRFLLRLSINIIAILVAVSLVPGLDLEGPWWGLALVALLFGLINTAIRPLLFLLTLPFVIITLGLFMLVINALMLYLTSWLAAGFGVTLRIDHFLAAVLGALIIGIVSTALSILSGDQQIHIEVVRGRRDD